MKWQPQDRSWTALCVDRFNKRVIATLTCVISVSKPSSLRDYEESGGPMKILVTNIQQSPEYRYQQKKTMSLWTTKPQIWIFLQRSHKFENMNTSDTPLKRQHDVQNQMWNMVTISFFVPELRLWVMARKVWLTFDLLDKKKKMTSFPQSDICVKCCLSCLSAWILKWRLVTSQWPLTFHHQILMGADLLSTNVKTSRESERINVQPKNTKPPATASTGT